MLSCFTNADAAIKSEYENMICCMSMTDSSDRLYSYANPNYSPKEWKQKEGISMVMQLDRWLKRLLSYKVKNMNIDGKFKILFFMVLIWNY